MHTDLLIILANMINLSVFPFALFLGGLALAGIFCRPRRIKKIAVETNYHFAIVVPAHNESQVIATTVKSALAVNWPKHQFDVIVIADNCSDDTATIAKAQGAHVIERTDDQRRSKGFALEDVLKQISHEPKWQHITAIMVVDADSSLDPGILGAYAAEFSKGVEFLQSNNTVRNRDDSWRTELMTYAFSLFNGSFQAGSDALGVGAHLRGNGMAFTRKGIESFPWHASSLAEDLEFSWRLRIADKYVGFVGKCAVYAEMPTNAKTSESQRRRWENGRKSLRKRMSPPVMMSKQPLTIKILWLLDLWLPPLSIVCLWIGFGLLVSAATLFLTLGAPASLIVVPAANASAVVLYLASPFLIMKLPYRYLRSILFAPYYAVWRMMSILGRGPTTWVRTTREK